MTTAAIPLALVVLALTMVFPETYAQSTLTTTATIDSAQLNRDGTVTVVFTVQCSEDATIVNDPVQVIQSNGRGGGIRVVGTDFNTDNVACDENGVQLTRTVVAQSGFFVPGRAVVQVFVTACTDEGFCSDEYIASEVVRLRR